MIDFSFEKYEVLDFNSELFSFWLVDVIKTEELLCGDINLVFVSDEDLLVMNQQYLNHDYFTDIITFDYTEDNVVSGDLFISVDRVKDNASVNNVDFMNELMRVMVHGVLHLCGYNDKTVVESKIMREKENYYLCNFVPRETN